MNFKSIALFSSLAVASIGSAPAVAEPSLNSILQTIDATTWSQTTLSALTSSSWNTAGSVLDFTLASENTSNYASQTFSITDGSTGSLVFAGSASNGTTYSYTLANLLSSINFPGSNFKVYSSATGLYAFAYEDWSDNDYQDMVVSLSVTPVPEPTTYAMLLAGLVGLGFVARRKNQG
ncbi:MAG: PEP-CTERM sorting domain-containing protein [Methylophilaceae bacterium]